MKLKLRILVLFLISVFTVAAQRNVILIIADDLGSDYCGFYENHLDTVAMPNIEKLLTNGVRFRYAWSNPVCSPTRAGILTGQYSFRTGVGDAIGGGGGELDTAELTIPRLLNIYSPGGIETANIGKWHLQQPAPSNYLFPNLMGYNHFEGGFTGAVSDYYNWTKVTNGVVSTCTNYATTETTNNAIEWIKNVPSGKPFFLWLAYNAPHSPFHLPPAGLYSDTTLSGSAADIAAYPQKYFKASVEALDHEIGRLFDSLQLIQKWDSTDIIFIGDNGDDGNVAQNTGPAKGSIYQEGVSVPFIISGPSVVNPNRMSEALVNTQDLFATILELFGDTTWQNNIPANKPVDSQSIMPILKNQSTAIRSWVFTEVFKTTSAPGDGKAMRNSEYKLLDFDNGTQKFYHISTDTTENNNLLNGTLNATEMSNYTYLCNEMSNLVGTGGFCTLTSIEETVISNSIDVFPNPSTGTLNIVSEKSINDLCITDLTGRIVFHSKPETKSTAVSLNVSGIYQVAVISGNVTSKKKVALVKGQ